MTSTPRVVSLVPSATETLAAWGVEPIAVTRFCERSDLVAVGGTKDPDVDAIVGLRPDLVVMCREENRRQDAEALAAAGLAVHVVDIDSVDDLVPQLESLAEAVGRPDVEVAADGFGAPPAGDRPLVKAFVPIWRRPWMTISRGTYGASVLAHCGVAVCQPVDGHDQRASPDRYPTVDDAAIRATNPDLVIAPSEPYPFTERQRAELEAFGPVVFVDGQDLFWWGVRTPAAIGRLRAVIAAATGERGAP